jgi:Ca2+-binding RTX toxin-like protein
MATITVSSATGQSNQFLFQGEMGGIALVFTTTATTYWVQMGNGQFVRYLGTGMTFSGNVPTGGTFDSIVYTDSSGNVQMPVFDFGSRPATQIVSGLTTETLLSGADLITGGGGNDTLFGYSGADTINGGNGNDTIFGGFGADSLDGGAGLDTSDYTFYNDPIRWDMATGAVTFLTAGGVFNGSETAVNFERAVMGNGNDTIIGSTGNDTINGGGGNDSITGGLGSDSMVGGGGADIFVYNAASEIGNDTIDGGANNNTLQVNFTGTGDFRNVTFLSGGTSIELLTLTNASGATVQFLASQVSGTGISEALAITDSAGTDRIQFYNATGLVYLANFGFNSWSATDRIEIFAIASANITGTGQNDSLVGSGDLDTLVGGNGDDTINGGFGLDVMDGGVGIDTVELSFSNFDYVWNMTTGVTNFVGETAVNFEKAIMGSGDDSVTGTSGDNSIIGGGGDDTIEGGLGNDTLDGGAGTRDIVSVAGYVATSGTVGVVINLGLQGTAQTSATGTDTYSNFEGATGSAFDDSLTGNTSDNTIIGGGGNDTIEGGLGNDTLDGGAGTRDIISAAGYVATSGTIGVEINLSLQGTAQTGATGTDTYNNFEGATGSAFNDRLFGSAGADTLRGGAGNDYLVGNDGVDQLFGEAGNDIVAFDFNFLVSVGEVLDGGADTDSFDVYGNNLITFDLRDDTVTNFERLFFGNTYGGGATVQFLASQFSQFTTLAAEAHVGQTIRIEIDMGTQTFLDLFGRDVTSFNQPNDRFVVTGDGDNESIYGSALGDSITGNGGADDLRSNNGNDTLDGGIGNDTLEGGDGADSLIGGADSDSFGYRAASELVGDTIDGGADSGGFRDMLQVLFTGTADFSGVAIESTGVTSIERLVLFGAGHDVSFNASQFSATRISTALVIQGDNAGADLVRINTISGSFSAGSFGFSLWNEASDRLILTASGAATITGSSVADSITGSGAADTLIGGNGNDTLDGGAGADSMTGGDGNEFYFVDNVGDVITEAAGGASGFDYAYASVSFTNWANVEYVLATGSAALTGTGDSNVNALDATLRFNGVTFLGLGGNDVLYGSNYADSLDGGADADILVAYSSVNGADTLVGGAGSDVYYLFETGDVVTEALNGGLDTVYTQANITMAANVEQAIIYGAGTALTGNATANNLFGNNSTLALTLDGAAGDDWLIGGSGGDTLRGGADNDIMQGLAGANRMEGGAGDDQFFSTSATDVIVENANEGRDTLYANYSVMSLAANVEQLISFGGATTGVGNSLANTLYGNNNTLGMTLDGDAGADLIFGSNFSDRIIGSNGNDTLVGLGGADNFAYYELGNYGADQITDFADGSDRILLVATGYSAASIGSAITITGGANALITFATGALAGTTITLLGVNQANIGAADFVL